MIATSSGAAAAYVREGYTNIRIGMFLEDGDDIGALAAPIWPRIFRFCDRRCLWIVLLASAYHSGLDQRQPSPGGSPIAGDPIASRLVEYPTAAGPQAYHVRRVPLGFGMMIIAGVLSGLLGIGSGAFKVLAMDSAMRIPFKVSTTTSNFMIGVTAAASAGIYLAAVISIREWPCR